MHHHIDQYDTEHVLAFKRSMNWEGGKMSYWKELMFMQFHIKANLYRVLYREVTASVAVRVYKQYVLFSCQSTLVFGVIVVQFMWGPDYERKIEIQLVISKKNVFN